MTAVVEAPAASTAEALFASLTALCSGGHVVRVARLRPADSAATSDGTASPERPDPEHATAEDTGAPSARPAPLPRARLLPAASPARTLRAPGAPLAVPPTVGERVRVLRATDRSLVVEAEDDDEDRGTPPAADPRLVVRRLATASVEVITGIRPAAQLARWVAPGVLDALRVRSTLGRHADLRSCRAPSCRAVRVVRVDRHAVEATAVVDDGHRVRAVAVRLETHRGGWRATALEVG